MPRRSTREDYRGRSPDSRISLLANAFPAGTPLVAHPVGFRPRSQWRVREGFAPSSPKLHLYSTHYIYDSGGIILSGRCQENLLTEALHKQSTCTPTNLFLSPPGTRSRFWEAWDVFFERARRSRDGESEAIRSRRGCKRLKHTRCSEDAGKKWRTWYIFKGRLRLRPRRQPCMSNMPERRRFERVPIFFRLTITWQCAMNSICTIPRRHSDTIGNMSPWAGTMRVYASCSRPPSRSDHAELRDGGQRLA